MTVKRSKLVLVTLLTSVLLSSSVLASHLPAQMVDAQNNNNPVNRGLFELYKDLLRQQMEKPFVTDPKLKELVDAQYREGAKIGSGSTAAAIRHEIATGEKVGGVNHVQKGQDTVKALEK